MKPRPRTPALWVLGRRRASAATAALESDRRAAYAAMAPEERLRRALHLSSFALRLRHSTGLASRRP